MSEFCQLLIEFYAIYFCVSELTKSNKNLVETEKKVM